MVNLPFTFPPLMDCRLKMLNVFSRKYNAQAASIFEREIARFVETQVKEGGPEHTFAGICLPPHHLIKSSSYLISVRRL
jgi:hypothetical protein